MLREMNCIKSEVSVCNIRQYVRRRKENRSKFVLFLFG